MIIDSKAIILTLVVVGIASIWMLRFVRNFALQIAKENHDAVAAMDQEEEQQRLKKERAADAAADAAFAKVSPAILKVETGTVAAPATTASPAAAETAPLTSNSADV
mmetsp:Transcript_16618/g.40414  ORF Transcript_16618/g.40414 Transcript_16618/m.40414 type:complete len:107 (-) Transcript_16618:337-657(-)|eukprot:CAMPEP_0113468604 /NCGR_PEP_ID=MMETSP0014_2-20120614/15447_1 /TAXON_ID=2857 /ORGANISM="Nitzschia sp." /LENGTH=106 /DNA_ID=CAMNT_0000361011 /DNA_START=209 /DNA_END=529 /DNA_ORIENTATION=+ /assembly_acc=CAM_ASM_000159